jgi:hypothetical protein
MSLQGTLLKGRLISDDLHVKIACFVKKKKRFIKQLI